MQAVNIYLKDSRVFGERAASPAAYLPKVPIKHVAISPSLMSRESLRNLADHLVIIGGGGLLHRSYENIVEAFCKCHMLRQAHGGKLVIWGLGLAHYNRALEDIYPTWIERADLLGVRDWHKGLSWLPDASCMSPAFDKKRTATKRYVVYQQWLPRRIPWDLTGQPHLSAMHPRRLDEALDFLGQGEFVITDNYYGAFWGTLLGRRVIACPQSSALFFMRHTPTLSVANEPLGELEGRAVSYPHALHECRGVSRWFRKRLCDLAVDLP